MNKASLSSNARTVGLSLLLLGLLALAPAQAAPNLKRTPNAGEILGLPPACPGALVATGGNPNGSSWGLWIGTDSSVNANVPASPDKVALKTDTVYASWELAAQTLNNGADGYVFGASVKSNGQQLAGVTNGVYSQAGCIKVGTFLNDVGVNLDYKVTGGDYGVTGTQSCSATASITVTGTVSFSVTGPSGSASVALGASVTCGTSTTFDSEVIFGTQGSTPL